MTGPAIGGRRIDGVQPEERRTDKRVICEKPKERREGRQGGRKVTGDVVKTTRLEKMKMEERVRCVRSTASRNSDGDGRPGGLLAKPPVLGPLGH